MENSQEKIHQRKGKSRKNPGLHYSHDGEENSSYVDETFSHAPEKTTNFFKICGQTVFLLVVCTSVGLGSLYFYDQQEFWTTIDKVDNHLKPLGANILWPDFQGIQNQFSARSLENLWDLVNRAPKDLKTWVDSVVTIGKEVYEDEAAIPASAADNIVRDDDQVSSQQDFIEPSFPASAQVVAEDDVAKNEEITSFTAPLSASASDKKVTQELVQEQPIVKKTAYTVGNNQQTSTSSSQKVTQNGQ